MPSYMSLDATKHNGTARKTMLNDFAPKGEKMIDCLFLFVGDRVFYQDRLCEIVQVTADGVMVRDGAVNRFIFATEIAKRKFVYRIEFSKGKFSGYEHTPSKEKAQKEKAFLESMGWEVKTYQVEVR